LSQIPGAAAIFRAMAKPRNRSTLYRLIEAGQLAHRALLAPLLERGLAAGDDALLMVLAGSRPRTEADIAARAGVTPETLRPHLDRLIERELVERRAIRPELAPGLVLTKRGVRVEKLLDEHFREVDRAIAAGLKDSQRKTLNKRLAQIAARLGD
jgi:DNA-binding MarR family transcriptional regulator